MAVGVTEIAKHVGLSKGTVSRYLNGDPTLKLKPETREKIDSVRVKLGFNLNLTKQAGAKLAHNFVIPVNRLFQGSEALTTLSFSQMYKSMEQVLRRDNFRLSLVFFEELTKQETFRDLLSSPDFCDGILLLTGTADTELAKLILTNKTPHVSIEPQDEELGLNTVVAHSLLGIRQAVRHLKNLGHTHFGFVGLKQFYRHIQFVSVLFENSLPLREEAQVYLSGKDPRSSEYQWREIAKKTFLKHIESQPLATAYFCQNDLIAFGVIDALREKGLEPGYDISVLGYDNLEERAADDDNILGLTTIDNPLDVIGKRCGQILLNQVFHRQTDIVHEHIPTRLIIRKTTGRCNMERGNV